MLKKLIGLASLVFLSYVLPAQSIDCEKQVKSLESDQIKMGNEVIVRGHSIDNTYFAWFPLVYSTGDTVCSTLCVVDNDFSGSFEPGIDSLTLTYTPVKTGLFVDSKEEKFVSGVGELPSRFSIGGTCQYSGTMAKLAAKPYVDHFLEALFK